MAMHTLEYKHRTPNICACYTCDTATVCCNEVQRHRCFIVTGWVCSTFKVKLRYISVAPLGLANTSYSVGHQHIIPARWTPCQRQCSLFTLTAADPEFPRFHRLAETFAKNIEAVVTSCTWFFRGKRNAGFCSIQNNSQSCREWWEDAGTEVYAS